jgi:hypothetical protein
MRYVANFEMEGNQCHGIVNGVAYTLVDGEDLLDADGYPLDVEYQQGAVRAELEAVRTALLKRAEGR